MSELEGTELVDWRELPPDQRRRWWDQLWDSAVSLSDRYRLALRSGWWEDSLQVEAIAAFSGWLRLYDIGAYTDPAGKLQLLWELERLRTVLRAGERAFEPRGDRGAFERYLDAIQNPARGSGADDGEPPGGLVRQRRRLTEELGVVIRRLSELRERERLLEAGIDETPARGNGADNQAATDLVELRKTLPLLTEREHELRRELDERSDC